jgi:hypothetical protein
MMFEKDDLAIFVGGSEPRVVIIVGVVLTPATGEIHYEYRLIAEDPVTYDPKPYRKANQFVTVAVYRRVMAKWAMLMGRR